MSVAGGVRPNPVPFPNRGPPGAATSRQRPFHVAWLQCPRPSSRREHTTGAGIALRPTRVRHVILGLTVAAYMITYMDRVVIAAAAPVIQKEFAFDLVTMGW